MPFSVPLPLYGKSIYLEHIVDTQKKHSFLATFASAVTALAAKVRSVVRGHAPKGYEDATGFHFGEPKLKG